MQIENASALVAHSPHLHYHLCFLLKLHNVFNTFVWCVKNFLSLTVKNYRSFRFHFACFDMNYHPFFKQDLVFLSIKVHIFWEGHKILRNLPLTAKYPSERTITLIRQPWFDMKLFVDFWKFTHFWLFSYGWEHRIVMHI